MDMLTITMKNIFILLSSSFRVNVSDIINILVLSYILKYFSISYENFIIFCSAEDHKNFSNGAFSF